MTTTLAETSVRESFATGIDGTRLYVRDRPADASSDGTGSPRRVTSIFSDGILCDGFIWKYLWDAVAARTAVAHWNYRGHGRSAAPADPDVVDVASLGGDLDAVREHVGADDVVLFGHSMGCQVALEAYRLRPKGVRGLVLLCGSHGRVTETFMGTKLLAQVLPKILDKVLAAPDLARAIWTRIPPDLALKMALFTGDIDEKTIRPEDVLPYMEHLRDVDFSMFLRMLKAAGEHDAEDLMPQIACPVLVVAGERDTFTPPFLAEQMARKIPQGELFVVPGGTHVAPLEQRDLVNLRIDAFLRDRVLAT